METAPVPVSIHVTPAERRRYNNNASAILRAAVVEHTRCKGFIDPAHWGHVRSRKRLSVFRHLHTRSNCDADVGKSNSSSDPDTRTTVMIGAGQIAGSLDDVMDGIYSDSTDDLHRVSALLGHKLVDGAVLSVSERRTASDPFRFEGIKWRAMKAAWGVTATRDVLTYERTGTIADKRGVEVAYHVVQSIERAEWPANALRGVKREQMGLCYLYRRDTRGFTRCFFWGEVADLHPLTQRVAEYVVAGLWLNVARSVKCARAKQCSELIAATSSNQSEYSSTSSPGAMCRVCYKRARFLGGRLVRCACCGQTTCKECAHRQPVFELESKTREPKQQRVCKLCLTRVRVLTTSSVAPPPRDHWDSAPASLGAVAAPPTVALVTPPLAHKMSRRIKYELLEPSSHATAPLPSRRHRFETPVPAPQCSATAVSRPSANEPQHRSHDCSLDAESLSSVGSSDSSNDALDSSLQLAPTIDRSCRRSEDVEWLDARRTEVLGEFDLAFDIDASADDALGASSCNMSERAHYDLAFGWRTGDDSGSSDDEKQIFLDDLYSTHAS